LFCVLDFKDNIIPDVLEKYGIDTDRRPKDVLTDVKTCFDSYEGKRILSVKRNGLVLSTIMQKL